MGVIGHFSTLAMMSWQAWEIYVVLPYFMLCKRSGHSDACFSMCYQATMNKAFILTPTLFMSLTFVQVPKRCSWNVGSGMVTHG